MPEREPKEENTGCLPTFFRLLNQYGEFAENLPGFAKSFEDWLGTFAGGFLNSFANWLRAGRSNPEHPLPPIPHPKNDPRTGHLDVSRVQTGSNSTKNDTVSRAKLNTIRRRRPLPKPSNIE